MLPNFLVIGAYKCGTTSLHHYLAQHPQIFIPRVKEPSYLAFVDNGDRNSPIYKKSIKTRSDYEKLFAGAQDYSAIGDVSPEYLTNPRALDNIATLIPTGRFIAIIRDPIQRAYSDYLMYRRDGLEREVDFRRALKLQEQRAKRGDPTGFYISTGFYGKQLQRYYDRFPRHQIHVTFFEDLAVDAPSVLADIWSFLDVERAFSPSDLATHNRSGIPNNSVTRFVLRNRRALRSLVGPVIPQRARSWIRGRLERNLKKPPMPEGARQQLAEIYHDDVRRLELLIGRRCSRWSI